MSKTPSPPSLSRRDFLTLLGAAGVSAAGGYGLYTYAPWLDVDAQTSEIRRPLEKSVTVPAHMHEIVRYATLAASGHNTQPWQFAITDTAIDIHPDYTRHLAAVDPHDRELWISLGCALENLLIAARVSGYATSVTYPDANDFIRIELATDKPQTNKLFGAITLRQNTRSEYDGQLIKTADFDQVQAVELEPGVVLHFVANPSELETVLEYVNQGNLSQYADKEFVSELIDWLRFTKKEALASRDGLYSAASGSPQVPRWLGQVVVSSTSRNSKWIPTQRNCVVLLVQS
jgi:hypothetical protein